MFIYETKHKDDSEAIHDALAICFDKGRVLPKEPDIIIWKDAEKAYVKLGDNTLEGALE